MITFFNLFDRALYDQIKKLRPTPGKIDKLYARPVVPRKWQDRSRYTPHQGPRELARRARQVAKSHG